MEIDEKPPNVSFFKKILFAFLFGLCSFLITIVNKVVLTTYKFHSYEFLGFIQMCAIILFLGSARIAGFISFPNFDSKLPQKIFPLPLLYFGNLFTGLGGTQKLSLPMFSVLRRFSILFTMILEFVILSNVAKWNVQMCVYLMIFGAIVAAWSDLAFDLRGYVIVLLNDLFTASNSVYTKKKLDAKELGEMGLIFYNSLFTMPLAALLAYMYGDLELVWKFNGWTNPWFVIYFCLSCVMGFGLMYSTVMCTKYNSALTTAIIGVLKNLLITYLGMFIGGDYIFSTWNFVGLNISVIGSLIYSYITFRSVSTKPTAKSQEVELNPPTA